MSYDIYKRMQLKKIDQEGINVRTPGFENPTCTIIKETKKYIVIKIPGHSTWAGIGFQTYVPAEYLVFKIVEPWDKDGWMDVKPLIDFHVRRQKK